MLQLARKGNEMNREIKSRMELAKEMEKEQQRSSELRSQLDSMKSVISSLQRDNKQLQDTNNDQKVSLTV